MQAEVVEQLEHEAQQVTHLVGGLGGHDVAVGVVLGDAADSGEALQHARLLVAIDRAELEEAQRQLAVRPSTRPEDQVVHRAVHGLEVVQLAVVVHGREHALGVVREVPRGVEELLLGDVRGADVLEAVVDVRLADVVLHLALDDAALRVEDRQPGAQLLREAVQVELDAEAPVVTTYGLGLPELVRLEVLAGRPGGPVQPLELLVLLVATPVRGAGAGQ